VGSSATTDLGNLTLKAGLNTIMIAVASGSLSPTSLTLTPVPVNVAPTFANASFETPSQGSGGYSYNTTGGAWTFYGNSGIEANGSAWGAANAPDGNQAAFLQSNHNQISTAGKGVLGAISQTVYFSSPGTYSITFQAARRGGQVQPIQVSVDGAAIGGTITPAGSSFAASTTVSFTISAAGNHTIQLAATTNTGDNSSFVDAVTVRAVSELTGAIIGTPGSWNNSGNTIANVFDGNLSTYFDAPGGDGDWVGLDLGSAHQITRVKYAPRSGYGSRMVGGLIQGSNTADFSSGVTTLYTINGVPPAGQWTTVSITDTGTYRYVRYLAPHGAYGNISELEFDGI
jgi:hypothetical protein